MTTSGFANSESSIRKIEFLNRGTFSVFLSDGRIITVPLKAFPEIQRLKGEQRKKWYVLDEVGFSWDDCNEVFHVEQILGTFSTNKYHFMKEDA